MVRLVPYLLVGLLFSTVECLLHLSHFIKGLESARCLRISDSSSDAVVLFDCILDDLNAIWLEASSPSDRLTFHGEVYNNFKVANTGKCLAVKGNGIANGAPIIQNQCIPGARNQYFTKFTGWSRDGSYTLKVRSSGKCLTVKDSLTENESALIISDCIFGAQNQLFKDVFCADLTPDQAAIVNTTTSTIWA